MNLTNEALVTENTGINDLLTNILKRNFDENKPYYFAKTI